jgi:alpha-amylase
MKEDFSSIKPFNEASFYHERCEINDWGNQHEIENCRLCGLPDLDQDNTFVKEYLLSWIEILVMKYNFDGIRVDTLKHVPKAFWKEFSDASGVF